jgi:hypothetical protein
MNHIPPATGEVGKALPCNPRAHRHMAPGVDIASHTINTWIQTSRTPNLGKPGDTRVVRYAPLTKTQDELVRAVLTHQGTWNIKGVVYRFEKLVLKHDKVAFGVDGKEVPYTFPRGMVFTKEEEIDTSAKRKREDEEEGDSKERKKINVDEMGTEGRPRYAGGPPNPSVPPLGAAPPNPSVPPLGAVPPNPSVPHRESTGEQQAIGARELRPHASGGLPQSSELLAPHAAGGIGETDAPVGLPVVDWDETDDILSGAGVGDDEVVVTMRRSDFARMVGCGQITPRLANRVAFGINCTS